MLISLEWLNDYIDISDLSAETIAETLTDLGLEIEGIKKHPPLTDLLVVGVITEAIKHPNADTLKICKVNIGEDEQCTIVCGAPNARVGLKAAVAKIGAVLPGDFKIKPSKIRGEKSEGMMCSEKELGVSAAHEGLWELGDDIQVGTKISSILDMEDSILDVSITPNRADCLSYIGIARDLGAKIGRPVKLPKLGQFDRTAIQKSLSVENENRNEKKEISVTIAESAKCGRFVGLSVHKLQAVDSPAWMQRRIERSGLRPINLIVDATNYVLLEYGQPIHAYDRRTISDEIITVREAVATDTLTTLDGQDARLENGDTLICDGKKPIGLAGVMGGLNSEIRTDTTSIFIEVAHFSPTQIRKTSKRLGHHTDASHRFERGIDIANLKTIAKRVVDLLASGTQELGIEAPDVSSSLIDIYPEPRNKTRIALRLSRAKKLLALPRLTSELCADHLDSLGFDLLDQTDDRMLFEVPTWRHDMIREIDLIEEIARLEGFNKIPYLLPKMNISPSKESPLIAFTDNAKCSMAGLGMTEVITFPFVSQSTYTKFGISEEHPLWPSLMLANPLSEESNFLQTSLLPSLLSSVSNNRNQGLKGSRLFEVGRGYFDFFSNSIDLEKHHFFAHYQRPCAHYTRDAKDEEKRPTERQFISGVLDFPIAAASWNRTETAPDFFAAKELVYTFLQSFGIDARNIELQRPTISELPFLHPSASAVLIISGKTIGWMGELHPHVAIEFNLATDISPVVFELDLDTVFEASRTRLKIDCATNKFPPISRDVALLVDRNVSHKDFETCFSSFKKKRFLKKIKLFDIYEGDKIAEDKKSYAYTLSFQSQDKTLTDKEVDKELKGLLEWTKTSIDAVQR